MDTTDARFEADVLKAQGLVLVDFWAPTCIPCHGLSLMLDGLAKELGSQIKLVKIDVDANPEAAASQGVRGLPTVLLFRDGEVLARLVGAQAKKNYLDAIKKHG